MNMKMKRIISIVLVFLCVLALVRIFAYDSHFSEILMSLESVLQPKEKISIAASMEEYVVFATTPDKELKITPFVSSDGNYYIVLPSMTDYFYFANLPDDSIVTVNGEVLVEKDASISASDSIVVSDSGDTLYVLHSQGISAMFIDVEVTPDVLGSVKGVRYKGECTMVDVTGNTVVSETLEYISARGNTTFTFSKKPYNLKFKKEKALVDDCLSEKWILLANVIDPSLLKNGTVYDFANTHTDIISPVGEYVDLYINGDYRGNYYLCDRPQYEDTFLESLDLDEYEYIADIGEGNDNDEYVANADGTAFGKINNESDVPGSECVYLVEFTLQDISTQISGFYTESGIWGRVVLPKNATLSQVEYIKNQFDVLENVLGDEGVIKSKDLSYIEQYLDVDSYSNRYLIDNVFINNDSGLASSWFYKKPDFVDTKIYTGPIWDYDGTWNYDKNKSIWDTDSNGDVYLSEQLLKSDAFVEYLETKYNEIYKPYVKYELPLVLYNLNEQISVSRYINNIRWDVAVLSDESIVDNLIDIADERLNAIENRILNNGGYCNVTFLDYDGCVQCMQVVKRGESLENIPTSTSWIAVFNGWISASDGTALNTETKIWEDVTYISKWIDVELVVQNGLNITGINIEYVDIETLEKVVDEIKRRSEGE